MEVQTEVSGDLTGTQPESLNSLVAMGHLFAFPAPLSFHGYEIGGKRNQKARKPEKQVVI